MMIPSVANKLGASRPKKMKPRPANLQVSQLPGGRHAHLEQEQAQHALECRHEELVVVCNDLLSLQPTDEADDDATEEENEPRVEEHFLQELTVKIDILLLPAGIWSGSQFGMLQLFHRELQLLLDTPFVLGLEALAVRAAAWPCRARPRP